MNEFNEFMGFVEDNYQIKEIKGIDLENTIKNSNNKVFLFFNEEKNKTLDKYIDHLLHELGIQTKLKGFEYIKIALKLFIENPKYKDNITTNLYPKIAKDKNTKSKNVEKAIHKAILDCMNNCNADIIDSYFGYSINLDRGHPTNKDFIITISNRIENNYIDYLTKI